ncbi:hypothetical protein SAMN05444392_101513 [Seinonella peptonophila]|uniref:Uncharacterized protein n=1 Tax=Seinonella peptonophila TaxID=112248 RepID=A0A1M4TKL2_9BACL|nr:hypothetical protein SAMN05444392_101513 [Seinonella peptonophila]
MHPRMIRWVVYIVIFCLLASSLAAAISSFVL